MPLGDRADGDKGPGSQSIKSYLRLLHREIELVPKGPPLATVYIGGGTPSLLTPYQIQSLLLRLQNTFGFQYGLEVTLEIDPASFDQSDLEGYLAVGVNRISLGGQSFDDGVLEQLGRRHRSHHLLVACDWLAQATNAGDLTSWSLDLIQNLPGQKLGEWDRQLSQAIDTGAPHLSIYDLSIESGTVFALRNYRGELNLPDEDLAAEIMRLTSSKLREVGFGRYEISNYALPGHASRHNRVYWSGGGWWGFGQGATSAPWGKRFARPRTRAAYKCWIENQETGAIDSSLLERNWMPISVDEQLIVGLRRREGVDLYAIARSWGWDDKQCEVYLSALKMRLQNFIDAGWLKSRGQRVQLSDPLGMEISNQVLVEILLWWESLPSDVAALSSLEELPHKVGDQGPMLV